MVALPKSVKLVYLNGDLISLFNLNNEYLEYLDSETITNVAFVVPSDKEIEDLVDRQKKLVDELTRETIKRLDDEADELRKTYDERIANISYMKRGYDEFEKDTGKKPVVNRFTIVRPDKKTHLWQMEG